MAKTNKNAKSNQQLAPVLAEDRKAALDMALNQIEKQFGKGAIQILGAEQHEYIKSISTGALSLDLALGIGGIPCGRVTEIFGPESSGKTTLALHAIAEAQKADGIAAFIDAEHALDPQYAEKIGVDLDNLIISQPDNGEQALEITEALARSGAIDLIVVDSVAALVPKAEIDGEMGDAQPGLQARLMSKALRKLAGVLNKSKTAVIFINQLREKIGIVYGSPETTTGGRALKFYASVRMDVRRGDPIKSADELKGTRTKVRVVKNKVAPPFKEAEFDIIYGEGISDAGCILDIAADLDFIEKSGSWYSYNDIRIGQGRDNARTWLLEHPEEMKALRKRILDYYEPMEDADEAESTEAAETVKADKSEAEAPRTRRSSKEEEDELLKLEL